MTWGQGRHSIVCQGLGCAKTPGSQDQTENSVAVVRCSLWHWAGDWIPCEASYMGAREEYAYWKQSFWLQADGMNALNLLAVQQAGMRWRHGAGRVDHSSRSTIPKGKRNGSDVDGNTRVDNIILSGTKVFWLFQFNPGKDYIGTMCGLQSLTAKELLLLSSKCLDGIDAP